MIAGALIFFAVCGGGCDRTKTSAKRLTNRGPLQPCKLPGIDEELLCGKLTVFENRVTRSGGTLDLNSSPLLSVRLRASPVNGRQNANGSQMLKAFKLQPERQTRWQERASDKSSPWHTDDRRVNRPARRSWSWPAVSMLTT
jgi:hypothetical protein